MKFGVRKKTTKEPVRFGRITVSVITILILFLLGLFYILQVNEVSTMGYEINNNDHRIRELEDQEKQLKVEEAKLKALQGLEGEIEKLNYDPADNIGYTTPVDVDSNDNIAQR